MSVFVEFTVKSPMLREARSRAPGMTFQIHDLRLKDGLTVILVFSAYGDEYEAFEAGMADDETLSEFSILSDSEDRRLYRATMAKESAEQALYPFVVDHDIFFQAHTATAEESQIRATVANEETFQEFIAYCDRHDISLTVQRILREHQENRSREKEADLPELTPAQREALEASVKAGYYEVPRQSTLEDVADELGVSSQATSERLRRGMRTVLRETLLSDEFEDDQDERPVEIR
ncbi:helix-turn-helix domain-containing protein [Haloarchaeobius sp. HME9146]|uniref:helix-turn-helix domain-containing protein n=1 Tax=Haloarchaeobius sp. HME9146 TaxID=2978732 RepID=UPI0021BF360E|nr:helix-turn-helix domain-containing protein [Haloarchaeobius sp. HME9146]MCT9095648.1 helix-turn-helix domain-containing protein [Haloarchaeobius sp. HME9146]